MVLRVFLSKSVGIAYCCQVFKNQCFRLYVVMDYAEVLVRGYCLILKRVHA